MKTAFAQMFRADPRAARAGAEAELAATRARLSQLQGERDAALIETAEIAAIRKIDREMEEAAASIRLLEDRCRRLTKAAREAERARLERLRDTALEEVVKPQFAHLEKLAARLQFAIEELASSFSELDAATRLLNSTWPPQVPKPKFWDGTFSLLDLSRRIEVAFQYASAQSIGRLVEFTNLERTESLAEAVARQIRDRLAELRAVPIELPPADADDVDDTDVTATGDIENRRAGPTGAMTTLATA
jgi:hypothetical protein